MPDSIPRVSVLVPTIGRVAYLPATRASLAAQTFGDYEILVLDNASPPEARALLDAWARDDHRVRVLRCEPRVPMFSNFKRGVLAARGEFVAFCHDDDVLRPRFLERSVAVLEANPDAAFSGTNYVFIDENGAQIGVRDELPRTETWSGERYIRALVSRGRNPITMQSVFYRRSAFGPEGFDDTIPLHFGDFVILMRMGEKRRVALIAESLVEVRQHAAQASNALRFSEAIALRTRLVDDYIAEYRARWPAEREFADELVSLNERARRRSLLWGWIAARADDEALACAKALDGGWTPLLRGLDRVGVRETGRRVNLAQRMRRIAGALGL